MLKIIGVCLIVLGAGGVGVKKAGAFYREMRQLRELVNGLELLKCELNYTLMPVAGLCRLTAGRMSGVGKELFLRYAAALDSDRPRTHAARDALNGTRGLCLPNDALMALLELFGALGRFDLDGENRLLQLTQDRLKMALKRCEEEKKPLARGYAALGICTGAALAILLV